MLHSQFVEICLDKTVAIVTRRLGAIKNELTPEIIANKCGYSVFHFSRVFNINQGMMLLII